jgi:glycosyltransferase involved in cell wall biosynthesis
LQDLKVALVHDDLIQYGGGERVFLAIKDLFPKAKLYTSATTSEIRKHLKGSDLTTSFMQRFPFRKSLQRAYFPFYPLAFESFDLSDYDLVISSSTRFAHGVITKPETKHLSYMHSPGRMFWEQESYFGKSPRLGAFLSPALAYLRLWDFAAAQRVDQFVANSGYIAGKISKYYRREAKVVHPFVDLELFTLPFEDRGDYFLAVSRLAWWKRIDLAVEAALKAGVSLKVVGDGPQRKRLERLSRKMGSRGKVEFLGWVSGKKLARLYRNCRALVLPQEEDFGIVPLEAQAVGRPVIAYKGGGVLETVVEGKTGEFFSPQTVEALASSLEKFDPGKYSPQACRQNGERFGLDSFREKLLREVASVLEEG